MSYLKTISRANYFNFNSTVILADSIRNYMSKFLSDAWMYENGFVDEKVSTALHRIALHLTALHFIALYFTALYFT